MGIEVKPEHREVTTLAIKKELRIYARQTWPLSNDKERKTTLQRLLDISARRMKSFWEGEETAVPRGSETASIEALIGHRIGAAADEEEANALKQSQDNYRLLESRIAQLEELYSRIDPEHTSEHVAAFRSQARGQGEGSA